MILKLLSNFSDFEPYNKYIMLYNLFIVERGNSLKLNITNFIKYMPMSNYKKPEFGVNFLRSLQLRLNVLIGLIFRLKISNI